MNVIVIGGNRHNAMGLVWSLGEAGHDITLLLYDEGDNNFINKSKYVKRTILIDRNGDVISEIKKVIAKMDSKPVVFADSDHKSQLLNEHFAELSEFCYIEGSRPDGSINLYRNKDEEEKLAIKCGFTVPETAVITKPEELSDITIPYPLFIKANNSIHGGKKAAKKCNSSQEAEAFLNGLPHDYFPLQVQEFVEKEYEIILLGCSLYGGKKVICPVVNKKIRQFPKDMGETCWAYSVEVSDSEELRQLGAKTALYLQELEYIGNFSIEFIYARGKFYFVEINLRNDGTSWGSTCSGYNLPDMVCRSFVDENVSADHCTFSQKHYMNILLDWNCVQDGSVKLWQWLKQFNRDTCYSFYNKNDKLPCFKCLFSILKRKCMRIPQRIFGKLHK